ncbi:ABC transporter ATP-binding protein [Aquabacterium humicola]|uniref:ABC transporter ATP-binding protein n=1 Tax=Aquabacterium humicola TaxID=3237377 RepID=UPI0025430E10|nr:ABC transporter ATP-binding protein [Rubrivivax pictus]
MNDRANTAMLHAPRAALPAGPALSARGLRVRLGDALVLHDVSVDFAPARWTAIVGPNGAGKSTLLRALAGLLAADGERRLHGVPVLELPLQQRARRLAWLAQQGEAPSELSAIDIVRLGRLPRHGLLGAPDDDDEAAVQRAMQRCECEAFADRRLSTLSGGERQRVLLARALAVQAPVLLLDEPTTHLDPPHQAALVRLMREEADAGAAVVSVLHELTLALAADWLVVLARGRLVAQGPADDAAVRDALAEVFDHALRIERVPTEDGGAMWAALPRLGGRL